MGRPRKNSGTAAKSKLSNPPYRLALDTIGNCRRELGRLYRAGVSGRLDTAEAARLSIILKEIRCALEAEEERAESLTLTASPPDIVVLSVPRGCRIENGVITDAATGALVACERQAPFTPTPPFDLRALPDHSLQPAAIEEPLPVHDVVDDGRVVSLHPHRHRDDGGPSGVA
jgi:hypothetical protein